MRIKSFYASTVEGAVALARRDLGSEAMLVQSRKTPIEARHLGEYEVVCAIMPETETAKPVQAAPEDHVPHDGRLSRELAELRKQLDVMGKTITRSAWSGPRWTASCRRTSAASSRIRFWMRYTRDPPDPLFRANRWRQRCAWRSKSASW